MPTGGIDVTSKRRRHLTYRANNGILERIHCFQRFAQRLCVVCPKMPIAIQSLISNIGIATQLLGPFVEARLVKLAYSPQGCLIFTFLGQHRLLLLKHSVSVLFAPWITLPLFYYTLYSILPLQVGNLLRRRCTCSYCGSWGAAANTLSPHRLCPSTLRLSGLA